MFTTSEQVHEIAAALADAQTRIGNAVKDKQNPAFRSSYATLASVDDAVRPELSKVGIAIVQATGFDRETGCVNVTTMLVHKSGQWFRAQSGIPVSKQDAQGIGSATTYGRRFGLAAMCGVAPDDDDDGNGAVGHGNAPQSRANAPQATSPRPQQDRPSQGVSDAVREENARKMFAVVREYGVEGDAEMWDNLDKPDKMAAYRRACARAKDADPNFIQPV
jgi:hypothetical protein